MASRTATALGMGAILLWASLATLTTLRGPVPPFQTTAIVFAIAAAVGVLLAALRGRLGCLRPSAASLALGVWGLFGYHALYFKALRLAPPAEAHLVASLWALLTVLFSGLLPGARLRARHVLAALLGLSAAAMLVWDQVDLAHGAPGKQLGFALAFACALVWSSYSVASRLVADVPSESIAVSCLATAVLALAFSLALEEWAWPADALSWAPSSVSGSAPWGPRSSSGTLA
jgi:drug/metabolite transporter (DMT)-like permease